MKRKPKWDLYEDGISYSALSKWVVDRERFRIRAVEGLAHSGVSEPIEFGNLFHHLLEWYSDGTTQKSALDRKLARYLRENSATKETVALAKIVFETFLQYADYWDDSDKRFVESERKFDIKIRVSNGRSIPVRGRRDSVYRSADGGLYLMENKTKGQIDHVFLESALPFNLQTMLYCHSIYADYSEEPRGVLYNVIRRPGLRQRVNETDADFCKRIREDIASRPDHYFVRHEVEFAKNDVKNFVRYTLQPLMEGLSVWWESIKHDPFNPWTLPDGSVNPHHFLRPFGIYDPMSNGKGEYFDYVTRGSRVGLVEVDTLFPELVED